MKIKEVQYSSRFHKSLRKYISQRKLIEKKVDLFIRNPFERSLKTHKLSGSLCGYWSFSINYHLRIIFSFIEDDVVGFIDIGTHGIYK